MFLDMAPITQAVFILLLTQTFGESNTMECMHGYAYDIKAMDQSANEISNEICRASHGEDAVCRRVESVVAYSGLPITAIITVASCQQRLSCENVVCESFRENLREPLKKMDLNVDKLKIKKCNVKCCEGALCNARKINEMIGMATPASTTITTSTIATAKTMSQKSSVKLQTAKCMQGVMVPELDFDDIASMPCNSANSVCRRVEARLSLPLGLDFSLTATSCERRENCMEYECDEIKSLLPRLPFDIATLTLDKCEAKCCEGDDCNRLDVISMKGLTSPAQFATTKPGILQETTDTADSEGSKREENSAKTTIATRFVPFIATSSADRSFVELGLSTKESAGESNAQPTTLRFKVVSTISALNVSRDASQPHFPSVVTKASKRKQSNVKPITAARFNGISVTSLPDEKFVSEAVLSSSISAHDIGHDSESQHLRTTTHAATASTGGSRTTRFRHFILFVPMFAVFVKLI